MAWVTVEEKALMTKKGRGVGKEMVVVLLILGSGESKETDDEEEEEEEEEQGILANFKV